MKTYATAYIVAAIVFLVVDSVWLSTMADRLYRPVMGDMLAPKFRLVPAIVFYVLFIGGLTFLAIRPGLMAESVWTGVIHGAVLGFIAYATYDLTNQATLVVWSSKITLADMAWGTFVSGSSATAAYFLTRIVTK
jgi:uncharacterized membrane protein